MERSHAYRVQVEWTGNLGRGTETYSSYGRDHTVRAGSKPVLLGSADPSFRGDATRYNPEELLVAALSSCHMLAYLHLCAVAGVRVVSYRDEADGVMETRPDGGGEFRKVTLHPHVTISGGDPDQARSLHVEAHRRCFIASSVKFPVGHEATVDEVDRPEATRRTPS
ncbi:MAG: OsmC family protein [Thermoplasmata archaeon]|nr:OsmC family protein [Thermoplasmata archaeon]MCI4358831.1 OsmC family protein [Thermoplasmata archaeon]